jgi:magnesium-transporting ATPase (P-type)
MSQVSIHEQENVKDKRYLLVMKGAPEIIFERCSTILMKGREEPLGRDWKRAILDICHELGRRGERVLGY